jgi:23S rRNA G2445 N2-methylase RlmL
MTILTAEIPDSLYRQIEKLAQQEKISVDQLVAIALSSQVSSWTTQHYIQERAKRGSLQDLQTILAKAPNVEPENFDKLPIKRDQIGN